MRCPLAIQHPSSSLHAMRRLIAFVFIIALANLGTSFASAILAKDTTTSNGELVDIQTNEAVVKLGRT